MNTETCPARAVEEFRGHDLNAPPMNPRKNPRRIKDRVPAILGHATNRNMPPTKSPTNADMPADRPPQGPLAGAWILRDAQGHPVCTLQISDPVDGRAGGAWRDVATNDPGVIDGGSRGGGLVHLKLTLHGQERAWLTLRPAGPAIWRGQMIAGGRGVPVTLSRE